MALTFAAPEALRHLVVPLLTVPQATHYVLDAWIWKFGGSNPGIKALLFGEARPAYGEYCVSGGHTHRLLQLGQRV